MWNKEAAGGRHLWCSPCPALTHLVLVAGVAGQVADEAGEGAQLVVVGGADAVQHRVQDTLLLQGQTAQHTCPLQGKHPLGDSPERPTNLLLLFPPILLLLLNRASSG